MSTKKNKEVSGFLKGVERIGNKLPHPAMLFFILSIIVVIISAIVAAVGAPVTYFDAKKGAGSNDKGCFASECRRISLYFEQRNEKLYRFCAARDSIGRNARYRRCRMDGAHQYLVEKASHQY